MDNKIKIDNNNYYLLYSIYIIKKGFPSFNKFYLIIILFKYFGIIANSRIIEMTNSENNFSINKYLSIFFIFGKNYSAVVNNYQIITIIGAFIIISFIIFQFICFLYMKARYKNVSSLVNEQFKRININIKLEENLFKIISYFMLFVVIFHQYIIEYYFFGFFGIIYYYLGIFSKKDQFPDIYIDNLHENLYNYFQNNNNLLIFIINTIIIIIIMIYFYIFMIFNTTKSLFSNCGISYSGNLVYLITKIIILSFQPFYGLINLYKDDTKKNIGIIINSIIIIICIISFWSCFHKFGYYPNCITNLSLFLEFFVFMTSITEIIIFFSGNKIIGKLFFVKFFIEIINALFFMKLFIYFRDKYNLYLFSNNLFSNNYSKTTKGEFYYFISTYLDYIKDKFNNYQKMYMFIVIHVLNCNKIDCPAQNLIPKLIIHNNRESIPESEFKENKEEIDDIYNNIINNENKINKKKEEYIYNNYKKIIENKSILFTEKQFQIIFEQEIINRIEYLYKNKKYYIMEDYIFIHIQYLIMIKKNYSLALYFLGKYNSCGINWSFMTQYFFYEFKKMLISLLYSNINNIDQNIIKNNQKDNNYMRIIINYCIFSSILKILIIYSCSKLKMIFHYREELHNLLAIKTYNRSRTKKFINTGKLLKKYIDKILYLLYKYIDSSEQKNISTELCYIISNFFIFIEGNIRQDLKSILNPTFNIISIADKLNSGHKFLNLIHPLILSLTKNDNFKISYFSSVICNRLGFFAYELKNQDFHEKLFPGVDFIKEHELLMKQFLFFDYNFFPKEKTYLKTKEGNLIRISHNTKKFPSFFDDFYIIVGIDFIDNSSNSESDKHFNKYTFLLNDKFEFVSQTNNFYEDYEFNIPMYKEIKINFLQFFNINKKKFMEHLRKKYARFSEDNHNLNNFIINLRKENDAYIIFNNIKYENIFELRDISKLKIIHKNPVQIFDKIEKEKVLKIIPKLFKLIKEYGLDFEWYQHIDNLKLRLSIQEIRKENEELTEYTKNIVSLGFSLTPYKPNKNSSVKSNASNISNDISNKSLITYNSNNNNKNSIIYNNNTSLHHLSTLSLVNNIGDDSSRKLTKFKNEIITLENYFTVVYTLRKIGSINYYLVDLYEKILNKKNIDNLEENKKQYKSSVSFKNINDNNILFKNENIFEKKKNENFKSIFTRAKSHFGNSNNNHISLDDKPVESILVEKESSNLDDNKFTIEQVKTLENNFKKNKIVKKFLSLQDIKYKSLNNILKKNKVLNFNQKPILQMTDRKNLEKLDEPKNKENYKKKINTVFSYKNDNNKNIIDNNYSFEDLKKEDKDDEKIPFITKDKIEKYIEQNYFKNRYYIIILLILYLISIILICTKLYFSATNFSVNSYLMKGILSLQEIKSDLYTGSLIILSPCYRNKRNDLNNLKDQMMLKSRELMDHLNIFENNIEFISDNRFLSNIIKYLYNNITIYHLDSDWTQKLENSYFLKEINYFGYALKMQYNQSVDDIRCNFDNNFYIIYMNSSKEIYKLNGYNEPTFNQRFIYYILMNIIYVIKPLLDEILEELFVAQIKIMDSYCFNIIIINGILIFVLILNGFIILLKNRLDGQFVKQIFIFLYHYEKKEIQLEYEINYLEVTAREFNINNLILLENLKKYKYYYLYLMQENNTNDILYQEISNKNKSDIKKTTKNQSKTKFDNSLIYQSQKNLEQKSINEKNKKSDKNLNNSLNNSSAVQLLNKNNNNEIIKLKEDINIKKDTSRFKNSNISKKSINKVKIKNYIKEEINNIIDEDEIVIKDRKETLDVLKSNNHIIPNTIVFSIIFSFCFVIFFSLIIILSTINTIYKKNVWEYSVNLSMNYLEKIPKMIELWLSTYITVVLGKFNLTKFYSKEEYKINQITFLRYFQNFENYDYSELISSDIDDSLFANRLYDCLKVRKNIEYCENSNLMKNNLIKTSLWNKRLNEQNNFCINACLGGLTYFNNWIIKLDIYFTYINKVTLICIEQSEKINESGLDIQIDYFLHELTYLYLDYVKIIKANITEARTKFFENENFKIILKDINIPYVYASGAFYNSIYDDMINLTKHISFFNSIFILVIFFIDGLFLIFLIFMIILNGINKKILIFITKIIKKN